MELEPSVSITGPILPTNAIETIRKHLQSYDFWSLNGLMFGVEAVKSLILALGSVDRYITAEEAVRLATLETEFQV